MRSTASSTPPSPPFPARTRSGAWPDSGRTPHDLHRRRSGRHRRPARLTRGHPAGRLLRGRHRADRHRAARGDQRPDPAHPRHLRRTAQLARRRLPAAHGRAADWPGQAAIALSALAVLYGVIQGPINGWTHPSVLVAFALGVVAFAGFLRIESRSASPLLRLQLFKIPAFATAAVVAVIGMFAFIGGGYVLSIRLGVIQHQSAMNIAWPFVILQTVPLLLGPVLARLLRRVSPRWLLVVGLVAKASGHLWLATIPVSHTGITPILGVLALNGVGFVFIISGLT